MSDSSPSPTLLDITRVAGIAGQFAISAKVSYPGEDPHVVTFTGSIYGSPGPIVMSSGTAEAFVTDASRFGSTFGIEWVKAFFS